jgi:NitT/TauT family transport system ATP-binding protein
MSIEPRYAPGTMSTTWGGPVMSADTCIRIDGLRKTYDGANGHAVEALNGVSFGVRAGSFVSVVGPSGCGKSTLLKILAGLLPKSSGEVVLNGAAVAGPRRDVGVVFQDPVLLPWRSVLENVVLPAQVQGLDRPGYVARARELLRLVGLEGFEERRPSELSGGMQQRAAIARALVHDPAVLFMDEPFGALDAITREYMNLELLRIWRDSGKTVLMITHSIPESVFLSDEVIVLSARPARVMERMIIDLPRPRTLAALSSPELARMSERIRAHLSNEVALGGNAP